MSKMKCRFLANEKTQIMSKMYNYTEVLNALVWILLLVSESVNVFIYAAVSSSRNLPPL